MRRIGIYPGSFDPLTYGHIDVIAQASKLVDRLVIAVGVHHGKKPMFSADERIDMLRVECQPVADEYEVDIDVCTFDSLVVELAREWDANVIIRGLRDATDFDYEMRMAGMNAQMAPEISTIFIPASAAFCHIAASLVRQVAAMGADVSPFVPEYVARLLTEKFIG